MQEPPSDNFQSAYKYEHDHVVKQWRQRRLIILAIGLIIAVACTYAIIILIPSHNKLGTIAIATLVSFIWALEAGFTILYIRSSRNKCLDQLNAEQTRRVRVVDQYDEYTEGYDNSKYKDIPVIKPDIDNEAAFINATEREKEATNKREVAIQNEMRLAELFTETEKLQEQIGKLHQDEKITSQQLHTQQEEDKKLEYELVKAQQEQTQLKKKLGRETIAIEEPTEEPTEVLAEAPTEVSTEAPTEVSTEEPTEEPTEVLAEVSTEEPIEALDEEPTEALAEEPTEVSTKVSIK